MLGNYWACEWYSYLEFGRHALGYILLVLILVMGTLVSVSSWRRASGRALWPQWRAALVSVGVVVVAGFGLGLAFTASTLLLGAVLFTWTHADAPA